MASGAFGGILFWTSVFPADVVKSRIQVTGSKEPFGKLLIKIFRQEGKSHYLKCEQRRQFNKYFARNPCSLQWTSTHRDKDNSSLSGTFPGL